MNANWNKKQDKNVYFSMKHANFFLILLLAVYLKLKGQVFTEIGYFEELFLAHQESKVKVILISLDFQDRVDTQILHFLKERA